MEGTAMNMDASVDGDSSKVNLADCDKCVGQVNASADLRCTSHKRCTVYVHKSSVTADEITADMGAVKIHRAPSSKRQTRL